MNRTIRTLGVAIFVAALSGVHAQLAMAQGSVGSAATGRAIGDPIPPDAVSAATLASDHWLAGLDAGNFGDSWKGAAEVFKLGVSEADWISQLEEMHSKLGKTTMREMNNAQFS